MDPTGNKPQPDPNLMRSPARCSRSARVSYQIRPTSHAANQYFQAFEL